MEPDEATRCKPYHCHHKGPATAEEILTELTDRAVTLDHLGQAVVQRRGCTRRMTNGDAKTVRAAVDQLAGDGKVVVAAGAAYYERLFGRRPPDHESSGAIWVATTATAERMLATARELDEAHEKAAAAAAAANKLFSSLGLTTTTRPYLGNVSISASPETIARLLALVKAGGQEPGGGAALGLNGEQAETLIRFAAAFLTRTQDCTYPEDYEAAYTNTVGYDGLPDSSALQELGASVQASLDGQGRSLKAVLTTNGIFRVHDASCRDLNNMVGRQTATPIPVSGTTREAIAAELYADFIADESMTAAEAVDHCQFLPCSGL